MSVYCHSEDNSVTMWLALYVAISLNIDKIATAFLYTILFKSLAMTIIICCHSEDNSIALCVELSVAISLIKRRDCQGFASTQGYSKASQ